MNFFEKSIQRKKVRALIIYLGVSWALIEALSLFSDKYQWDKSIFNTLVIAVAIGFIIVLIFNWFYVRPHTTESDSNAISPDIFYTKSFDGTKIAYAKSGNGPIFVKSANYLSHLDYDWKSPVWKHWIKAFEKHFTLIRYDERGCGLSDWKPNDLSFDAWVKDLIAIVDALELEKFPLFGMSQGVPVALAYASMFPEKVSHLILVGGYARGWLNRDLSDIEKEEEKTLISLMKIGWGKDNPAFRQFFTSTLMPEATVEQMDSFNEMMRVSSHPEIAAQLEVEMHKIDVQDLAKKIKVPTIIFHAYKDSGVSFEEGRLLAELIPKAKFIPLESRNHLLKEDEPAWEIFLQEFYKFLEIPYKHD